MHMEQPSNHHQPEFSSDEHTRSLESYLEQTEGLLPTKEKLGLEAIARAFPDSNIIITPSGDDKAGDTVTFREETENNI